jgi:transcription-repair coupling factor (superfamily II helicase)
LAQNKKALQPQQTLQSPPAAGEIVLVKGIVEGGWVWKDDLFVLTDYEIMGFVKQSRRRSYKRSAHAHSLETITPGDYVVHIDHVLRVMPVIRVWLMPVYKKNTWCLSLPKKVVYTYP